MLHARTPLLLLYTSPSTVWLGLLSCLIITSITVNARDLQTKPSKRQINQQASKVLGHNTLDKARPSYIYHAKLNDTPETIAFEFLDKAQSIAVKQQFFVRNGVKKKATRQSVAEHTPFIIPVAWMYLKPSRATVLAVSGTVQSTVQATDSNLFAVAPKAIFAEGARIQTGANSFASIALPDGSILAIEPSSDITLETLKQYASSDIFKINIVLNKGRVESTVKPFTSSESSYTVKSKRLTTGVRGTRFAVSDSNDGFGNGLLEVLEGAVAVNSPTRGAQNTATGYGRVVQVAEPSEPIALFSKPTWFCVNNTAFSNPAFSLGTDVSIVGPEKTNQLKFDIYSGKHSDTDIQAKALKPLKQNTAAYSASEIDLALAVGDYTVVARAIDSYGLQGYSALQTITIKAHIPIVFEQRSGWVRHLDTLSWAWQDNVIASSVATRVNPLQTQCSVN